MSDARPLLLPAPLLWLCQLGACAILAMAGYSKVSGAPSDVALFTQLGMEPDGRLTVGVLELISALGLLHSVSAPYAALIGAGVLTGAGLAHMGPLGFGGMEIFLPTYSALLAVLIGRWRALPFAVAR